MLETRQSAVTPRVSIISIFLNGEAFLTEAIESVIAQTFSDWELLLVDDGSGPAATAIAKKYASQFSAKIRYLEHPNHANRGMSASRNLGIEHALGEFIAFIDADDVWLPTKLASHLLLLDANQEVGMVCGATIYWSSWSDGEDIVAPTGHRQNVIIYPPEAVPALFPLGPAAGPSMSDIVLRAALVRRLGGFEEQFTGHYESRVFLSKVFLSAPVYFCSAISNKVRMHPASSVATAFREGKAVQNKLLFLEWLEQYLSAMHEVDARVVMSLRRALRSSRHPRLDYLITAPQKIQGRLRSLLVRTSWLLPKK
jgi:glycosyltransferase involved in cell wall biosynthesis